jgi:hypothetical protein
MHHPQARVGLLDAIHVGKTEGVVTPSHKFAGNSDHQPSFTITPLKAPLVLLTTNAFLISRIA